MDILFAVLRELGFYTTVAPLFGVLVCVKLKKRKLYFLRLLTVPVVALLFNGNFWKAIDEDLGGAVIRLLTFQVYPHIILFALGLLIVWFCYDIDFVFALFLESLAFVLIRLFSDISDLVLYAVGESRYESRIAILVIFFALLAFIAGVYFLVSRRVGRYKKFSEYKALMVVFSIVDIVFAVVLSQLVFANTLGTWVVSALRIVLCVALVALPFIIFSLADSRAEKDLYAQMLSQADRYRRQSSENIEAINIKYHDLKYRLAALREGESNEERNRLIADLERDLNIYGARADTGNSTLDVVLTEKGLLCNNYKIKFLTNINAAGLSVLHKGDLYVLMGNALDNAIEAVKGAAEEKRIISLDIASRGDMVSICVENYCEVPPKIVNGLPQTTKDDKINHGFGVRSMRNIVETYGGQLYIDCGEHSFRLSVFLPSKMQVAK